MPPLPDDLCRVQIQRNALVAIREGLKAIGRVYPDMAEVAPRLVQANKAIAQIGDGKAIHKFVSGNRNAALAAVKMKPALAHNPAWEKGLRDGFARLKPDEMILKLNLYSANWYVQKMS